MVCGTRRWAFLIMPDAKPTHTINIVATATKELPPMGPIHAANRDNPSSTTIHTQTNRPLLHIALSTTVMQYTFQHSILWPITCALIQAFMSHSNWAGD